MSPNTSPPALPPFGLAEEPGFTEIVVFASTYAQARTLGHIPLDVFLLAANYARMTSMLNERPALSAQLTANADAVDHLREQAQPSRFPDLDLLETETLPLGPWISALGPYVDAGWNPLDAAIHIGLIEARRPLELQRCAFHEAGHALAAALLQPAIGMVNVSLTESTDAACHARWDRTGSGSTFPITREHVMQQLCVHLAGRVAVQLKLGDEAVDNRGCEDLEAATRLAWNAITHWGLDPEFGVIHLGELGQHSDYRAGPVFDQAQLRLQALLTDALARTRTLMAINEFELELIAGALLATQTLSADDIHSVINNVAAL